MPKPCIKYPSPVSNAQSLYAFSTFCSIPFSHEGGSHPCDLIGRQYFWNHWVSLGRGNLELHRDWHPSFWWEFCNSRVGRGHYRHRDEGVPEVSMRNPHKLKRFTGGRDLKSTRIAYRDSRNTSIGSGTPLHSFPYKNQMCQFN